MTREEAIARIEDHKIAHKMNEPRAIYISEALDMAIEALKQEPKCRNCVSRDYLLSIANKDGAYGYVSAHEIINAPSVNPQEPKTGHWINLKHNKARCSECDDVVLIAQMYGKANYCPNCGAKMESKGVGNDSRSVD